MPERSCLLAIDGSQGEGGGQVLRTALGLAMYTGRGFTMTGIRAGRQKPGLLRQHLTAVLAAAELSSARVQGAELNSRSLTFCPGPVRPGRYRFSIGSAGSCSLVFQALLPALLLVDGPSEITIQGGTHNPMAPTVDFLQATLAPLIKAMGAGLEVVLDRPGFYPAGGGRVTFRVEPASRLVFPQLLQWEQPVLSARVLLADLAEHIGQREARVLRARLGLPEVELVILKGVGPGNVLTAHARSRSVTETLVEFGQKGLKAERVASRLTGQLRSYLATGAPVGPHLADQLLPLLALCGSGAYCTGRPTLHTTTNCAVIEQFLDVSFRSVSQEDERWRIEL